jgi:hypothetical protein
MDPSDTKLPPVVDYGNAYVVYADGLARVDEFGPCSHLVFTTQQRLGGQESVPERAVAVRVIVPTVMLPVLARMMLDPKATIETAEQDVRRFN